MLTASVGTEQFTFRHGNHLCSPECSNIPTGSNVVGKY